MYYYGGGSCGCGGSMPIILLMDMATTDNLTVTTQSF